MRSLAGNPPFLGDKKMRTEGRGLCRIVGAEFTGAHSQAKATWCYWFEKTRAGN